MQSADFEPARPRLISNPRDQLEEGRAKAFDGPWLAYFGRWGILGDIAMQMHTVEGGGGLKLHVREWGPSDGPAILFIHGWSQHHLCWGGQIESSLAKRYRLVALDIRGHGQSEAPLAADSYTRGELWADDIKNLIESLNLTSPLLVGWSYGGLIIGDYLRRNGDAAI